MDEDVPKPVAGANLWTNSSDPLLIFITYNPSYPRFEGLVDATLIQQKLIYATKHRYLITGMHKMIGAIIAKRKVRAAFDAFNRRDLPAFLANWREDCTFIYRGNPSGSAFRISGSGRIEGKKALEQFCQKYWEQFPKWNITVKSICVENMFALGGTNVVLVDWEVTLTDREGRSWQEGAVSIIHLKGGKALWVCDYKDIIKYST